MSVLLALTIALACQRLTLAQTAPAPSASTAASPDPSLFAQVGFNGHYCSEKWTPVRAFIQGGTEPTEGVVVAEVINGTTREYVAYAPFVSTPGQTIRVELNVILTMSIGWGVENSELLVSLQSNSGRTISQLRFSSIASSTSINLPLSHAPEDTLLLNVGVDSLQDAQAEWLANARTGPSTQSYAWQSNQRSAVDYWNSTYAADLRVDDLPYTWAGYDSIATVVIRAVELDQINEPQRQALETWVRSGGRLIIIGPRAGRDLSTWFADAPTVVAQLVTDDSFSVQDAFTSVKGNTAWSRRVIGVESPNARSVGDIFTGPLGLGLVAYLHRDPAFYSGGQTTTNWKDVLTPILPQRGLTAGNPQTLPNGSYVDSSILDPIADRMNISSTPPIAVFSIIGVLLALLIGPIDRFVLGKFNKRHLSWGTAVCWIALFSLAGYLWPRVLRQGDTQVSRATVIDVAFDRDASRSPAAWGTSVTTILPSSTRTTKLSGEIAQSWWRPISPDNDFSRRRRNDDFRVDSTSTAIPLPIPMTIWSPRSFLDERPISKTPIARATKHSDGTISITVDGVKTLTTCTATIDYKGGHDTFTLPDGASHHAITYDIASAQPTASHFISFHESDSNYYSNRSQDTITSIEEQISFLPSSGRRTDIFKSATNAGTHVLITLSADMPCELTLDESTRSYQRTIYRLLVPLERTQTDSSSAGDPS